MIKQKLVKKSKAAVEETGNVTGICQESTDHAVKTSPLFSIPFWKNFLDIEYALNPKLKELKPPKNITHIYNPLEYAEEIHVAYIKKYFDCSKSLIFIGMNPGANGMGQTGVPFGNISTVRHLMLIDGKVNQPEYIHSKRPVVGFECTIEEPSGARLWNLFNRLSGDLDVFSKNCCVYNFCPLIFFDKDGKNITPNELKGDYKTQVRDLCLETLDDLLTLVNPEIIVAVGDYVYQTLKKSKYFLSKQILKLPHPSPRSLNNHNWPEKAELFLKEHNLLKYIKNEF